MCIPAPGNHYYVRNNGSDSNPGTVDKPWKTVGKVNNAPLQPGDGVFFEGGQAFSDNTLMPSRSGTPGKQIVYASHGTDRAKLTQGAWCKSVTDLAFQNLEFTSKGVSGSGSGSGAKRIIIMLCDFHDMPLAVNAPSDANDTDWLISLCTVERTGDSGMLLQGWRHTVDSCTIVDTGQDRSIPYGKHGVYLKCKDSKVSRCTIQRFSADGVSCRYQNAQVVDCTITDGPIPIAWFQYATTPGTTHWERNTLGSSDAGIYVSPSDHAGKTTESFVIHDNKLTKAGGVFMNLEPTTGRYDVADNTEGVAAKKTEEAEPTRSHPSDYRSAVTGRFVTDAEADADPDHTVKEG